MAAVQPCLGRRCLLGAVRTQGGGSSANHRSILYSGKLRTMPGLSLLGSFFSSALFIA